MYLSIFSCGVSSVCKTFSHVKLLINCCFGAWKRGLARTIAYVLYCHIRVPQDWEQLSTRFADVKISADISDLWWFKSKCYTHQKQQKYVKQQIRALSGCHSVLCTIYKPVGLRPRKQVDTTRLAKELNLERRDFVFDHQPDTFRSGELVISSVPRLYLIFKL